MLFFRKKAVDDGAPASGVRADALPPVQVIRAQAGQLAQALPAQPEPRVRLALGYVSPNANMDAVVVVSAPPEQQRERVLARPGMTAERLDAILSRQMHDAEKRARAHFVVDTSRGLEPAREQVAEIIAVMRDPQKRPGRDKSPA